MDSFDHILVYVQRDLPTDAAIARARALARACRARVKLVTVFGHESSRLVRREAALTSTDRRRVRSVLEACADALNDESVHVSVKIRHGRPSDAIVDEVLRGGHDLVIKTANPAPGMSRWRAMGTTAVRLLRYCPCPVWIAKRGVQSHGPVLAAIDPYDEPERCRLNDAVMELSGSLSRFDGGDLHVVHVWDTLAAGSLAGRVPIVELGHYVASSRWMARRAVDEYLHRHRDLVAGPGHVHLVRGEPPDQISALAARIGASVVVMGNRARTGLSGFLIGNTAEEVLPRSAASIVAIRSRPNGAVGEERAQRSLSADRGS